jgi:hypothetical protein
MDFANAIKKAVFFEGINQIRKLFVQNACFKDYTSITVPFAEK